MKLCNNHGPITVTFRIKTINNSIGKLLNPPKAYKWDSQGSTIFSSLINCKDSKMKIKALSETLERNKTVQNLEKAAKVFTEFITNCANRSLKLKRRCKTNKKHNKPWYNETCATLQKQFKQFASLLQKNPKNINIINNYQKIRKKYKYTLKIQKRKWEENNIKKLETLTNNPKQFWQHLKTLKGKLKPNSVDAIPPRQWIEHFSKLFIVEENTTVKNNFLKATNPKCVRENSTLDYRKILRT